MDYMKIALMINFAVFSIVVTSDAEVAVLRAVRGRPARLPCGQGRVFLDGPLAYVLWLKNDKDFLYRYPNGDTQTSAKLGWQHDSECTSLEGICNDETSLVIKQISESDSGLYRCRVHYQASPSQDYVIDVRLVDSPGVPKIYSDNGEEITKGYVGPFSLGADFTFVCEVEDAEDSETLLYWRRNGVVIERISSNRERILHAVVNAQNITRNELNAHYECVVQNADVTEPLTRSIVVKMYLPPLSVEIRLNNNVNFEAGSPRLVDCVVIGCMPPPTVTWHLEHQLLRPTSHKEVHEGNYTVSSLSLSPFVGHLQRLLKCRAHNSHLTNQVYEDTIMVNIGYRPVCNGGITAVPRAVDENLTAHNSGSEMIVETVKCEVESMPEPIQFTWTLPDSRTLVTAVKKSPGKSHRYVSTLTWIPRDGDIGTLSCSATNIFGEQKQPCEYTVSSKRSPQPPKCVIKHEDFDLFVICDNDSDSNSPTIYLEALSESGLIVYNTSNNNGHFCVTTLSNKLKNLSLRVYSMSSRGVSSYLYLDTHQFVAFDLTDSKLNSMGRFTLISCLIVAVLIVGVILFVSFMLVRRLNTETRKNPDVIPTDDGSFHREPELERDERILASTNITVTEVVACQNGRFCIPAASVIPGTQKHSFYV